MKSANKYKYKVFNAIVKQWLPLTLVFLFSCHQKKQSREIEPCFYYWKSDFKINSFEKSTLDSLHIKTLYIKFFDIDWDETAQQPLPKAKINFKDTSYKGFTIIPTIFITNECIQKIDSSQITPLASNIFMLLQQIITNNSFSNIAEIQFDCDWSASTKNNYFLLLRNFKKLYAGMPISATIRLHQIKFTAKTGIPPVDRGLLMCYNMGNLKNIETENSILSTTETKKYTDNLSAYPLPLDAAFPLFSWKVLFRNNMYSGLIENLPDGVLDKNIAVKNNSRFEILEDTVVNGYAFKKGDVLRDEQSNYSEIIAAAEAIKKLLKNTRTRVSLYHLDSILLKKYSTHELETVFNSLR